MRQAAHEGRVSVGGRCVTGSLTDERIEELAPLFDIVLDYFGPDDIQALWTYITSVFDDSSRLCAKIVQSVSQAVREEYMTLKDKWIAEGRSAGLSEGRATGKAETLLEVLELRDLVVPVPVRERVLSTRDEQQLRRWLARAFTVASAEELVGPLGA